MRVCQREGCGEEIPTSRRADALYCSNYCRLKRYDQSPKGKIKSVEKVRRYQLSEKGSEVKKKADRKYYQGHKEKWLTQEGFDVGNAHSKARRIARQANIAKICISCKYDGPSLEIHHKDFDPFNNLIENLEYLCKRCHKDIHGKTTKHKAGKIRLVEKYSDEVLLDYLKIARKILGYSPRVTDFQNLSWPETRTFTKRKSWLEWLNDLEK